MRFLSVSAKGFWLFLTLVAIAVVLFMAGFSWFFGRSPAREFGTLRANVNPLHIQSWALEILRQFPNGTNGVLEDHTVSNDGGRFVFSNAPAVLKQIPTFGAVGPEIIISGPDTEAKRRVELVYFCGGWGNGQTIFAGSQAFTLSTNSHCFRWAPGVYYRVW